MKPMALMKKLAWTFGAMGILLIFVVFDWLPTVKDLSRLRREQRDETLKIKNFTAMASGFVFPDAEEKSLFAQNNALLRHSLPQVDDNDAWLAMALLELQVQVRAERIANARVLFTPQVQGTDLGTAVSGRPDPLNDWLFSFQLNDIWKGFSIARDSSRLPWHGVFSGLEFDRQQHLASRPLAVAIAAPLPALLDFINHISWGDARLEIVRLYLEPGAPLSRAWLICRGTYLVRKPSAWAVKEVSESVGDNLMVDPDSPLLWQKVNSLAAAPALKNELPPMPDTRFFMRKEN